MIEGVAALVVILAIGLAAVAAIRGDAGLERRFVHSSTAILIGYFAACGIVIAIVVAIIPDPASQAVASAATVFVLAWIALCSVWLIRLAPRFQDPPEFLTRPWRGLDWTLIALALAGLGYVLAGDG